MRRYQQNGRLCSQFNCARCDRVAYFSESDPTRYMDFAHIRNFTHKHCRFKLRSGKEVFGVIWEVETAEHRLEGISNIGSSLKRLYFASIRDYERLKQEGTPVHVIPMQPEEIVLAESLAS